MTPGAAEQIRAEAGAMVREEALIDVWVQASYTAFMPAYVVPTSDVESASDIAQNYSWLYFVWTPAEQSMEDTPVRGGFGFDITGLEGDPIARTEAKYEALLDDSLSPAEVSEMLGVNVDDVNQRLEARSLYGVPVGGSWRILDFQLEDGQLLPGIEEVLPLLHEELHPIAVYNWFVNPNVDLAAKGKSVSPRQWLISGRNVAAVARIAIDV